jgi:alkylation response protein AidB-like acyl-CoA dehydrogenase
VRRIAADLAPAAQDIDHKGIYPADFLRSLGEAGAFSPHLVAHTRAPAPDLGLAIRAMAEIGASCMSTAFCMWCQDACAWYLENTANAGLRDRLQPGIAGGALMGGTGLSNPVKALSGIERFKLKAQRAEGGYVVSGVLPWVSNLGDGHWFGTVFEEAADPAHKLMAMVRCGQPGVDIRQNARFIALEGTGTYSVLFRKAFIADEMLLADPLGDMVKRIKPGFILLQTGMGLGVVQAAIELMHEANRTLGATNRYLPKQVEQFEAERAGLLDTLMTLAATPLDGATEYVRGVLSARLRCSELALEAAQAALLHTGARGYIEGSAVSRVLRESYFVAIITPSIKHLRQELELLGRH